MIFTSGRNYCRSLGVTTTFFVLLVGCHSANVNIFEPREWGSTNELANGVSVLELVSRGEEFDEWPVRVTGVVFFDGSVSLLFRDSEAARVFLTSESIRINFADDLGKLGLSREELIELSGSYIVVEGVYQYAPRTRRADFEYQLGPNYIGVIDIVNRIAQLQPY